MAEKLAKTNKHPVKVEEPLTAEEETRYTDLS